KSNLLLHNPDERRDCESHVPGFSFQRRLLSVNPLSLNLEELTTTRPATTTTIVAIVVVCSPYCTTTVLVRLHMHPGQGLSGHPSALTTGTRICIRLKAIAPAMAAIPIHLVIVFFKFLVLLILKS